MKKKKLGLSIICNTCLFASLFILCCTGAKTAWEAIEDPQFKNGLALTPLNPSIVQEKGGFENACVDTLSFSQIKQLPVWKIAQWYSKYTLKDASCSKNQDGSITYANQAKKVIWHTDGEMTLELKASKEYERPRESNDVWPHLLLEQSFTRHPNIGKVGKILFNIGLKLEYCSIEMPDSCYNPDIHTAQFPIYFVLKNINKKSHDYNTFIWFGIPTYDYRYPQMLEKEKISWDKGTSTYIYNVSQISVWGHITFTDRQWHYAQIDLLPLVKRCVEKMKAKGYFLSTQYDDLEICGMNLGWEIPGTFDAAISIGNLSLYITDK